MMVTWWLERTWVEQVLMVVACVAWLYQLYFYLRYILAAVRRTAAVSQTRGEADTVTPAGEGGQPLPGVSVIVCAKNEEQNLRDYLQAWLTQDYPEFEVIVVNDGSLDDTRTLLEYWEKKYRNLHVTFVPIGAQVISTKKLAITLGAKAARYDYLLLTDADCRPESTHWISEMMRGFDRSATDIVLGFGAYFVKPGLLNRLIQFDTLFAGLQYLGMAVAGHPYMGVGRNLAYRKSLFFAHKGFAGLLTNRAGDDDLFVNREATRTNTAVIATPDSLTWSVPKLTWRDWLHQKRRHLSVAPRYRAGTKFRLTLEPLSRGLLYASVIALVVLAPMPVKLAAIGAMVLRWLWQVSLLNIPAARWGTTQVYLLLPLFEVLLPLVTLVMMLIEPLRPKPKRW